jgi:hypothetical protein
MVTKRNIIVVVIAVVVFGCIRKPIYSTGTNQGNTDRPVTSQTKSALAHPYILGFPSNTDTFQKSTTIYDLRGAKQKVTDLIPNFNIDNYSDKIKSILQDSPYMEKAISSNFSKSAANGALQIEVFQLQAVYGNAVCGASSTVNISNRQGKTVVQLSNIDVNIVDIGTTPDNKNLFISYGYFSESFNNIVPGYRIYNLTNKKILVDEKMPESEGAVCYLKGNLVSTDFSYVEGNERLNRIVVTDIERKTQYRMDISNADRFTIEQIQDGELLKVSKADKSTSQFHKTALKNE